MLTRLQILQGNPDGTYRPQRNLNRAEFMQIVMRILPDDAGSTANLNCFPDVRSGVWYADPVCRAKQLGIVRCNVRAGVPASEWLFEPSRDVQYEEALKVLSEIFELPVEEGPVNEWYLPYLREARDTGLDIAELQPGDRISRGEMARLTAAYMAESVGRLDELRSAEGISSAASSRSASSRSSLSASSRSSFNSFSSRSGSSQSLSSDSYGSADVRSNFLLLGSISPAIAGVSFFSSNEAINVTKFIVTLAEGAETIDSLLVYDDNGSELGTATALGNSMTFNANIPSGRFLLPRREDRSVYVRARISEDGGGGVSGRQVKVSNVQLEGVGEWSSETYSMGSSNHFPVFETANARITAVENAGPAEAVFMAGADQLIGEFRVRAETPDPEYDVRLNTLVFTVAQTQGVTLSTVRLRSQASDEISNCTVSSVNVTCASVPASIGTINDAQIIRVYATVTAPSEALSPTLMLSLNRPGDAATAGDITWSDEAETFTWVALGQPIANGTRFR